MISSSNSLFFFSRILILLCSIRATAEMEKKTLFVLLWKSTYLEKHRFYTDQEETQHMHLEGKNYKT